MKLKRYLKLQMETHYSFSKRAKTSCTNISNIVNGGGASLANAIKIVKATGGKVDYKDLLPSK